MANYIITNGELYHHGVKGMKWGVRRYQNKDGSLTPAGKKRLAASIKEAAKDTSYQGRKQLRQDIRDDLNTNYKEQIRGHINNINAKRKAWLALDTPENDYHDSGAAAKDSKVAYKKTLDWFEKNRKDYLDEIIKLNDGSKDNLDMFHDFRKAFEGCEDVEWQAGEKRFYKENNIDRKAIDKAYDDYLASCKTAADSILGEYGNDKVAKQYSWENNRRVKDLLADAMFEIV